MTSRDHLCAAARCWERAGFYEDAAERFTTAEAWHDAGRCFSQSERHNDAAVNYARAGEPLLEAREHLMGSRPERAWALYERLRRRPSPSLSAQVEVLLGYREVEVATGVAVTSGDCEAVATFASLTSAQGRPELAAAWWSRVEGPWWDSFTPWNRSLHRQRPPPVAGSAIWPSVKFSEVSLSRQWEADTGDYSWGNRALSWSADSECFAAALWDRGFARGGCDPKRTRFERRQLPGATLCIALLPASRSVLTGNSDGQVLFVGEDGSVQPVENLQMLNSIWSISFSPGGDRGMLASGSGMSDVGTAGARLKLFSWKAGHAETLAEEKVEAQTGHFPLTVWSPDGRPWWSPGPHGPNRIFVLGQQSFEAHGERITGLAITADGRFLITASPDHTVVLRDGCDGQSLAPTERFDGPVTGGVSVHPRAALIALGEDKNLHLLRLQTGGVLRLSRVMDQEFNESVMSLAFSPDGRYLLVMTGEHQPRSGHLHLFRVDLKP